MQNGTFIFAAYTIIWAAFFVYVLFLNSRIRDLKREIDSLKQQLRGKEPQKVS